MDLVEAMPKEVAGHLRAELHPGELLMILLAGDIQPDGQYGESWFGMTDERLLIVHINGADQPRIQQIPLQDIQRVQTKNYIGTGALTVEVAGETVELVRFSQSAYYKFSGVPQAVEAASADVAQERTEQEEDTVAPPVVEHCQTCNRALKKGTKVCPYCIHKTETFWRLFSYIKPHKKVALLGFLLTLGFTAVNLSPPLLNVILIDEVLRPAEMQQVDVGEQVVTPAPEALDLLWAVVLGLLGVYVARALINGTRTYCLGWLGQYVVYDLQVEIFQRLQQLSLSFFNQHSTGRIMTRVTTDTGRLQRFITRGFQDMAIAVMTVVGIGVIMFWMNWELALISLIPMPLMVVGTLLYTRRIHWVFHRIWRRISTLNSQLADTIPGVKVVKAFAQESREIERFTRRNNELRQSQMEAIKMRAYFTPTIAFTTSVGSLLLWWYGGERVLSNTLTLGQLQAFIAYMMMFYQPVRELCFLSEQLESAATTAERVFEVLDTEPEVDDAPDAVDPGVLEGRVEFRDVSFTYDGFARILDKVSFDVEPGEMIGIVGPSGSGKSTLVNLISRFYDASDGQVFMDGRPIEELQQHKLRGQIGVVLQEPLLFQGSVADNIAYGRPDATREDIIDAARAANAHKFIIRFPDGYDTEVGERGGRLSGGERQRISIARALIGNPRILILDEATASVDTQTEYEIQEALERLVANRTTFAIAHRLSTLKNADRLLVVEKGRIAEVGSHAELLAKEDGVYRRLVDMQTELAKVRAL
ncbi:MAG: ATP-binding cassette domain-containing protein [Candidatus Latescibacteria bacterium]|nr:ATP-binding cassette domain-containing protein [Candidatus Latescibacterota bacterium]